MEILITGLLIFLGSHSVRIVAEDWRNQQLQRWGKIKWKAAFSLVALTGLLLIIKGYSEAATNPVILWLLPAWINHLVLLLMMPAFILLVATYWPGSAIKARVGHPMLLAVKIWALAHLLANGSLADLILFGSFLIWAVIDFAVCRRRDRREGVARPSGSLARDIQVTVSGIVIWALFAFYLHSLLFGVSPMAL